MNFSNENNSLGGYLITNNKRKQRLEKLSIQIKFTQDHQIVYSKEGAILRIDKVCDAFQNPEIFNNLDYIHYLFWQGQYCKNKMKVGKWIVFWDKVFVKNVGGYYKDGEKQGIWIDLFLNYQNQAQIFTSGEYYNNFKMGFWKYIYQDKMIGGGYQNKFGQKQGKWIELDDGFCNSKQVTFEGEYKMKGMKVDRWNIMYCFQEKMDLKKCKYFSIIRNVIFIYSGGGSYYQLKEQKKIGKWVELDEGFYDSKQVTDNGEYNKEGMKIGRWDINFCKYNDGGGSYDEEVGQKKIGKWVELDEGFDTY
ncbi:unnamed protein product [Paramecium sonneborni]|uniref:MORN repeat protein n=1 Tax=Paramecium sonneborni TaxID=65129 RepID=A0A8S1RMN0_9CILI|nr:unnamed protein product [Paramecium sonneborni]